MATTSVPDITTALAGQAADLSSDLYDACEVVHQTGTEVESMAEEIAVLSAVLWRLYEDVTKDIHRYTEAFMQDLEEILQELKGIFDEVAEVGKQLRKIDDPNQGSIKSFFRRSKVSHLRRYLEALKSTLVVMRTVLQHGKEYATQKQGSPKSPGRLSGADPHVMFEDKTILETVIKTNRDAIANLEWHDTEQRRTSTSEERRPWSSGGPAIPPIPEITSSYQEASDRDSARESFSRNGMRLGVHRSIMDMGAHTAPETLKDKWIRRSRSLRARSFSTSGTNQPPLPNSPPQVPRTHHKEESRVANASPRKRNGSKSEPRRSLDKDTVGLISTPTAEKLHKVINSLEHTHVTGLSKIVPRVNIHNKSSETENKDEIPAAVDEEATALPHVPESPEAKTRFPIH